MTTVVLGVPKGIWRRVRRLLTQPVFVALTVMGNGCILAAAGGLYLHERDTNPGLRNFVDALWWSYTALFATIMVMEELAELQRSKS